MNRVHVEEAQVCPHLLDRLSLPPYPPSSGAGPTGRSFILPSVMRFSFKRRAEAQTGDTTAGGVGGKETSVGQRPQRDRGLGGTGVSAGRRSRRDGDLGGTETSAGRGPRRDRSLGRSGACSWTSLEVRPGSGAPGVPAGPLWSSGSQQFNSCQVFVKCLGPLAPSAEGPAAPGLRGTQV